MFIYIDVYDNFPMLLKNDGCYNNYECQDSEYGVWCKNYYVFVMNMDVCCCSY